MDIKDIIENLEHYNNWRRDNDDTYTMPEPKQIGLTIDAAISELNKLLICVVSQQSELLFCKCGSVKNGGYGCMRTDCDNTLQAFMQNNCA